MGQSTSQQKRKQLDGPTYINVRDTIKAVRNQLNVRALWLPQTLKMNIYLI